MMELLFWYLIKHFVCDFPLQAHPYQYLNKGTYGHPGGLLHSAIHGVGSALVLILCTSLWTPYLFTQYDGDLYLSKFWIIVAIDMVSHYHIDWAKVKVGKRFNLKPDNSEWFWILLGFDQLLHMLVYWFIIFIVLV